MSPGVQKRVDALSIDPFFGANNRTLIVRSISKEIRESPGRVALFE
jgi:hypothetical protein